MQMCLWLSRCRVLAGSGPEAAKAVLCAFCVFYAIFMLPDGVFLLSLTKHLFNVLFGFILSSLVKDEDDYKGTK